MYTFVGTWGRGGLRWEGSGDPVLWQPARKSGSSLASLKTPGGQTVSLLSPRSWGMQGSSQRVLDK